jgi:uncharacterized membrane protein YhhN
VPGYDRPPPTDQRSTSTTTLAAALLAAAAFFAVLDWYAVAEQDKRLEYLCKPATLALLTAVALAIHPTHDARRTAFVVALLLSLAGDVFLMLPRDLFAGGLAAFLLGHLAYFYGFREGPSSTAALIAATAGTAVLVAFIGSRVVRGVRGSGHKELTVPVVAYMVVLSAMLVTALATVEPLAALGAGLFYCSDAVLAWNRFVQPLRRGPLAVIVTYHLAQGVLVLSLLR